MDIFTISENDKRNAVEKKPPEIEGFKLTDDEKYKIENQKVGNAKHGLEYQDSAYIYHLYKPTKEIYKASNFFAKQRAKKFHDLVQNLEHESLWMNYYHSVSRVYDAVKNINKFLEKNKINFDLYSTEQKTKLINNLTIGQLKQLYKWGADYIEHWKKCPPGTIKASRFAFAIEDLNIKNNQGYPIICDLTASELSKMLYIRRNITDITQETVNFLIDHIEYSENDNEVKILAELFERGKIELSMNEIQEITQHTANNSNIENTPSVFLQFTQQKNSEKQTKYSKSKNLSLKEKQTEKAKDQIEKIFNEAKEILD